MSRERISERCAPMRLQASCLSKRRWQGQSVEPGAGVESEAALDGFNGSGRRPICDEDGGNNGSRFA
jgi:hypothetical protein